MTMENQIHLAIQIVPLSSDKHPYFVIDKAIDLIQDAGFDHQVGPMETVIQGPYEPLMELVKKIREVCFEGGADELVINLKIHTRKNGDIHWEEKNRNGEYPFP